MFSCPPHKYEPRYDEVPVFDNAELLTVVAMRDECLTREVYVCDVCVKCGRKVARPEPLEEG